MEREVGEEESVVERGGRGGERGVEEGMANESWGRVVDVKRGAKGARMEGQEVGLFEPGGEVKQGEGGRIEGRCDRHFEGVMAGSNTSGGEKRSILC